MPLSLYEIMIAIVTRKPAEFNSDAAQRSECRHAMHQIRRIARSLKERLANVFAPDHLAESSCFLARGRGRDRSTSCCAARSATPDTASRRTCAAGDRRLPPRGTEHRARVDSE
jgi:hypothetical protein